jgi:adenosylmethionine-8-amino-7-oxononanoate aminotransferase
MSPTESRSATSPASLAARDRAVVWHPCSHLRDAGEFPPVEIVAARGCRLTFADGRTCLDAISSWWCKSLGHGHPRLLAALAAQAARFEHVITADTTHRALVRVSERLVAIANGAGPDTWGQWPDAGRAPTPGPFATVFYAENGSTAIEIALKMALQYQAQSGHPGRTAFAALSGGYHGETVGALSVGDCGLYKDAYAPLLFPCTMITAVPWRSGPGDPHWQDCSAEWPMIEAQLAPIAGRLAAVIYEPVLQGAGGMRPVSPDLQRRLRAWADAHGVLLIADEIAAGMGRCGTMLAGRLADQGALRCHADFAVLGKGLTGGCMPLAGVATTATVRAAFDAAPLAGRSFLHSTTYSGHALALAVADAALDVYANEKILDQVARHGPLLHAGLAELMKSRPYLRNLRSVGMVAAVDLCAPDGTSLDPARRTGRRVYREAVARGAWLRPLGDTLYLCPPLNTAPADLAAMIAILANACAAVFVH